jgi:hypothetical protein
MTLLYIYLLPFFLLHSFPVPLNLNKNEKYWARYVGFHCPREFTWRSHFIAEALARQVSSWFMQWDGKHFALRYSRYCNTFCPQKTNHGPLSLIDANWKWRSHVLCFTAAYLLRQRSFWAVYRHVISQGSMLPTAIKLSCTFCRQERKCDYFLNHPHLCTDGHTACATVKCYFGR